MGRILQQLLLPVTYKFLLPSGFRQQVVLTPLRVQAQTSSPDSGCRESGKKRWGQFALVFFSLGLIVGIEFVPTREVFCHDLSHFLTSLLVNDLHLVHFLQSTKGKG